MLAYAYLIFSFPHLSVQIGEALLAKNALIRGLKVDLPVSSYRSKSLLCSIPLLPHRATCIPMHCYMEISPEGEGAPMSYNVTEGGFARSKVKSVKVKVRFPGLK